VKGGEDKKMEIKTLKEYFTKEDISRLRVIIFLIGIVLVVFMETKIFGNLNDVGKVLIYAFLFGSSILLKIDYSSSKEVGKQIMAVYRDKKLTTLEKCNKFGNMGMQLIHKAGELWELSMDEQFPEKEPEVIPDAEKEEILAPATWTQPLEDPEIE